MKAVTIRIPDELHKAIRIVGAIEGKSINQAVVDAIAAYVAPYEDSIPKQQPTPED